MCTWHRSPRMAPPHRLPAQHRPACFPVCSVSYKLERIPTLMKWGKTKAVGALIEDQCKDAAAVEDLVSGDE